MENEPKNLFSEATNPKQYDLEALYWEEVGAANSPTRKFFRHYLLNDEEAIKNKDILDIGSGTGWLLEDMRKIGARSVTGIEPSQRNVAIAEKNYPEVRTVLASLEDFNPDKKYDLAVSIMAFPHVANVQEAMDKVSDLLKENGEFHLVVPDFEYTKTPRFGYGLSIEERNEDEYVAAVKRSNGVLVDVVRKLSIYKEAAARSGLDCTEETGLKPTPGLLEAEPKYKEFADQAIADLLRFKKG